VQEVWRPDGFAQPRDGPRIPSPPGECRVISTRQKHDRDRHLPRDQGEREPHPAHPWQVHITYQAVDADLRGLVQERLGGREGLDVQPGRPEEARQRLPEAGVVLGTGWYLRAFAADGMPRWTQPAPASVWATNITADGRLVVAACGDGTIRWHRMDDGREVLALFPLADRRNWVAWTPEGIYAATPGAHGVLRWHVNRGWDAPAEAIPVAEIPETYRPEAIRLMLQTLDTPRAIGLAILAEARAAIQRRTGAAVAPGARLHVLTVGVSDYGQAATHLKLNFAAADATDVAAALLTTQTGLYAEVRPQRLSNQDATLKGILRGLDTMRKAMARSEPGRDLAVVHFSGHGALIDGTFYLLPHDVDVGDSAAIKATALSASSLRLELDRLAQYGALTQQLHHQGQSRR